MDDDGIITGKMLLEHMQFQFNTVHQGFSAMNRRFDALEMRVDRLEQRVERGFEEARVHREMLQVDLDATIRMQFRHEKELATLSGRTSADED